MLSAEPLATRVQKQRSPWTKTESTPGVKFAPGLIALDRGGPSGLNPRPCRQRPPGPGTPRRPQVIDANFFAKLRLRPPITEHDLPTPRDPPCYLATVFARSTRHASITTLRHATATSSIKSPGRVCSRCSFVTCP